MNQGAARVGKRFRVGLDFLDHQPTQHGRVAQDFFELLLLVAQLFQLLLNLDRFQPGQLAQADLQNIFGLPLRQLEARHQRHLGVV